LTEFVNRPSTRAAKGDEHRDDELNEVNDLTAAMVFRQHRINHSAENAAAEQHEQNESRLKDLSQCIEGAPRQQRASRETPARLLPVSRDNRVVVAEDQIEAVWIVGDASDSP
jgi:hypothetical protein